MTKRDKEHRQVPAGVVGALKPSTGGPCQGQAEEMTATLSLDLMRGVQSSICMPYMLSSDMLTDRRGWLSAHMHALDAVRHAD
jgi:hypothetical protein